MSTEQQPDKMDRTVPYPKIKLAPYGPEYQGFLHASFVEDPPLFRWLFPFGMPDRETFVASVSQAVSSMSILIKDNQQRTPLGFAYLYEWRRQDGVAFFQVSLIQSIRESDVSAEAVCLYVSHIFSTLNIRKLFVKGTASQLYVVDTAIGDALEAEGRLRDHVYSDGQWHDQLVFSLTRDRFYTYRKEPADGRVRRDFVLGPSEQVVEADNDSGRPTEPTSRWLSLGKETRALMSSRVRLVSPQPAHMRYLHGLASSEDAGHGWRFGGIVPTFEEFLRRFQQGVFVQFVPTLIRTNRPFGHLLAYQGDPSNGHVCIGGVTEVRFHRTGYPIEAFVILLRYLFTNWDFRKIYMDLPEYNRSQIFPGGLIDGVQEEARLRDVVYRDGEWWDWSVLSITRTYFRECLGL